MSQKPSPSIASRSWRFGPLLAGLALLAAIGAALVLPAGAQSPAVTDLSSVAVDIIEAGDIVDALAVPRGTRLRAGARPRVRLPVHFEFGSVELEPEARPLLRKLGKALRATDLERSRFSVEGHTDSFGGEDFNANLSRRRAEVVRAFLESEGVGGERLEAVGRGASAPVDTNRSDKGRQRNRRVEIVNLGSDA